MAQVIRLLGAVFFLSITAGYVATLGGQVDPDSILPTRSYYVYVCAESEDEVAIVRYGPAGLEVVKTVTVGSYPAETEGPHGVALDPSGNIGTSQLPTVFHLEVCINIEPEQMSGAVT